MNQLGYPALRGREKADVAIVGGGLTGLTIGLALVKAGLRVQIAEAARVGSGASAGCAGVVTIAGGVRLNDLQLKRGRWAADCQLKMQWEALESLQKTGLFQPASCQIVAQDEMERESLAAECSIIRRHEIAAQMEAMRLHLPDMGVVAMPEYWQMLLDDAENHGIRIWEKTRITTVDTSMVCAEDGCIRAPYIVIATGFPIISAPGRFFAKMAQRERWRFDGPGVDQSRIEMESRGEYLISQTPWATHLQLWESRVVDADDSLIRREARQYELPLLGNSIRRMEAYTMDGLPFIGPCSAETPNLFVASGYCGSGLLGSRIAAACISAHILGLPSEADRLYSVDRPMDWRLTYQLGKSYLSALFRDRHTPHCPHMGCPLHYDEHGKRWQCPCHGSQFDDIGRVLTGPSVRDVDIRDRK